MSFFREFRKNWADLKILDFVKEKTVGTQTVLEISYTDTKGKKSKIQRPLSTNGGGGGYRPEGWLDLPMPTSGSQEFYGLYAVSEFSSNYIALSADGTEDYVVDWGDGNVETVTAGTKAQHQYDFNDLPSSSYYAGGDFRQAIVKVSMLSGGDMTAFSLDRAHDDVSYWPTAWLDINLDATNLTSLAISPDNNSFSPSLLRAGIYNLDSLTVLIDVFRYCPVLSQIEITGGSSLTEISNFIDNYCFNVRELPLFDTSNVDTLYNPFGGDNTPMVIPLYDFSNVTSADITFGYYGGVMNVPALDFSSVSIGQLYFNSVSSIKAVGIRIGLNIDSYSTISKDGLVELFTNLGIAESGAVINLYCPSRLDLSPSEIEIATDKGFTVVIS